MNYDLTDIPTGYDRGRDLAPEMLDLWMDAIESQMRAEPMSRILSSCRR